MVHLDAPAADVFPGIVPAEVVTAGALDAIKVTHADFTAVGYGVVGSIKPLLNDFSFDGQRRFAVARGKAFYAPAVLAIRANPNSGKDRGIACSGDSGGAVFLGNVLVGVMSTSNCQGESQAGRLDSSIAREFLADVLGG